MKEITVTFHGAKGRVLHGWVYIPEGKGPFPVMIYNHGSEKHPGNTPDLPHFYTSHGYILFKPIRHGHGISSGFNGEDYDYIVDLENAYKQDHPGDEDGLQNYKTKLHEIYNEDVVKALEWIKSEAPLVYYDLNIDKRRIVMTGISYGGIQTILTGGTGFGITGLCAICTLRRILA
jgi:cephalosporin-C deacetylase-like acetyl esterase